MARTASLDKLDTQRLIEMKGSIDRLLRKRMEIAEQQLTLLRDLTGGNGTVRRARRGTARVSGRRRAGGGKPPRAGSLGGKIMAALKGGGARANKEILATIKLPSKKQAQLGVALSNLKKRGFVRSPSRGHWMLTEG